MPGIDGFGDRLFVGLVDEHRDRPGQRARQGEALFQHVASRIFEIDEDDVGGKPLERGDQPVALDENRDVAQARIAQTFLDHGRARRAFVHDRDLQPDLLLQCSKIIAAAKEVNQRLQFPECL